MSGNVFAWKGARGLREEPQGLPACGAGELHEVHGTGDDRAAALAFALGWGRPEGGTGAGAGEPCFLLRLSRQARRAPLSGQGLASLGIDPARLTFVEAPDELALLRAGLDVARSQAGGTVLLETMGRLALYDLTASRRLALAAEKSRCRVVVLRCDGEPRPSAARGRWAVKSAASTPLEARAPGWPALDVELLRWRGGPSHYSPGQRWRLEWDADNACWREADKGTGGEGAAALPRPVVPLAANRAGAAGDGGARAA